MNLPEFLKKVDKLTANMSQDELKAFVHEVARILPEEKRSRFYCTLKAFGSPEEPKDKTNTSGDDGYGALATELREIQRSLSEINQGERCLDSEYNEEWDDWYNSDADQVLFTDPEDVLQDIVDAVRLLHKCIDMELYKEGCELAETLTALEVCAGGDYNDYDGSPLGMEDLNRYKLLDINFETMVREALYLTYMGNVLENRVYELFYMLTSFECHKIKLEDILQTGNHELPEFDEFLTLWCRYLGSQTGSYAEELLIDAQSMIQDDSVLLENARKFVDLHPALFEQLLRKKLNSNEAYEMLEIGKEALNKIPVNSVVRSRIALLSAEYATQLEEEAAAETCWIEAFRSDPSVINFMRIRFLTRDWPQYAKRVKSIYEQSYSKTIEKNKIWDSSQHRNKYLIMLFFDEEFDKVFLTGLSEKQALGWSMTFMKQGLAFFLLLLYKGEDLPSGLRSMLFTASAACNFKVKDYFQGTNRMKEEIDVLVFWEIFRQWKKQIQLSDEQRQDWLTKLDKIISQRVTGIMDGNYRKYYNECASYIAALGEVQESHGIRNAKAAIMGRYKMEYSRRRAFHHELGLYGMRK